MNNSRVVKLYQSRPLEPQKSFIEVKNLSGELRLKSGSEKRTENVKFESGSGSVTLKSHEGTWRY